MSKKSFENFILDSMFAVSKKPVLLKDLLEANATFNEGMLVDPSKLNFRFKYGETYAVFGFISLMVLVPAIAFTHKAFQHIDFHFSIFFTVLATAAVFIGFDVFKANSRKKLTKKLIQAAWEIHFPYFPYEKYSTKVEEIYDEAVKNEVPKRELEQYVLDKLVQSN